MCRGRKDLLRALGRLKGVAVLVVKRLMQKEHMLDLKPQGTETAP